VMEELDYTREYGDSLDESLKQELSPTTADILLSNKPLTQRRKRDLLVETTVTVERRDRLLEKLDDERTTLRSFGEELKEIKPSLERLPECSPQRPLEELLDLWEQYNTLEQRCEGLLQRRQEWIRDFNHNFQLFGDIHALHEYLYSEIETFYPVLSALADALERIDSRRRGYPQTRMINNRL
jgi:predicted nuclease with TOPRIM domain